MQEEPLVAAPPRRFSQLAGYISIVLLMLVVGAGVCAYLIWTKPSPTGEQQSPPGPLVRAFRAQKTSHRVAVTAYGNSRAGTKWTAIAEVKGRAVEVDLRFEPGEILPRDFLLVRIDTTDYQLAVDRLQAEAKAKSKQLDELTQNEANLKVILELQDRQLVLAASERDRQRRAFERKAAANRDVDRAENDYVMALTAMQQTRNKLALLPVQRELTQASLDAATAHLEQARRDLKKCEIRLPFAARCATKTVEEGQYVAAGERLGTFLDMQMAEVVAMVEVRKMPTAFSENVMKLGMVDLGQMSHAESIWKRFRVPVEVSWGQGGRRFTWWGRVARFAGGLDPDTRTVPVIVEVPHPYKDVQPGVRPPLLPDVFCQITAYGATLKDVVVIPRDALRDGLVYLVRDGKLHRQPVTVAALEEELAVVSEGIAGGDLVVLTDLFPASEAMPLRVEEVPNPAKPRTSDSLEVPDDLFEDTPVEPRRATDAATPVEPVPEEMP